MKLFNLWLFGWIFGLLFSALDSFVGCYDPRTSETQQMEAHPLPLQREAHEPDSHACYHLRKANRPFLLFALWLFGRIFGRYLFGKQWVFHWTHRKVNFVCRGADSNHVLTLGCLGGVKPVYVANNLLTWLLLIGCGRTAPFQWKRAGTAPFQTTFVGQTVGGENPGSFFATRVLCPRHNGFSSCSCSHSSPKIAPRRRDCRRGGFTDF